MEPIKIHIEVNLGEATLALLSSFVPSGHPTKEATTTEAAEPKKSTEKKAKAAPKPAELPALPEPEPAPAPVMGADPEGTGAEDIGDLPPDDAPDPVKKAPTPTEDDARQAVKAARNRGVPAKAIKEYMKGTFDIASSVECPADRRQELIDGLNKLAA